MHNSENNTGVARSNNPWTDQELWFPSFFLSLTGEKCSFSWVWVFISTQWPTQPPGFPPCGSTKQVSSTSVPAINHTVAVGPGPFWIDSKEQYFTWLQLLKKSPVFSEPKWVRYEQTRQSEVLRRDWLAYGITIFTMQPQINVFPAETQHRLGVAGQLPRGSAYCRDSGAQRATAASHRGCGAQRSDYWMRLKKVEWVGRRLQPFHPCCMDSFLVLAFDLDVWFIFSK